MNVKKTSKKLLRTKRKNKMILKENKSKARNLILKNEYKKLKRTLYRKSDKNNIDLNLKNFSSIIGQIKLKKIFHKNKCSRIISGAMLFKNKFSLN